MVLKATHRDPGAILYWHINGIYSGETHTIHQLEIPAYPGSCDLTIVDQNGESLEKKLQFIEFAR